MAWRARRVRFADVARLQEALGCPEPLAWVLVRRGLGDPADARAFLGAGDPAAPLGDPEDLPGIAEAADRLAAAVRRKETIAVHGDYDCDGITSTAILVQALRGRGATVRPFLPSRFTDGYGVSSATVEMLAGEGCDVLVCVDCGTTAVEPLTLAVELGMDPVVVDHHLAAGARPPGIIANPALGRGREDLPAAAGVVLMLVRALAARLDGGGTLAPDPLEAIDLVALATVADAVPLVGENRRLVARGLAAMRTAPRPGILALCRAANVAARALDARHLGFTLAPCLNAAGRMAHPERGLDLCLATSATEADAIAAELWGLNLQRRDVERRIVDEAVQIIDASPPEVRDAPALVVAGDGWHEGVVGIVASRIVERYTRPAIVLTRDGDRAKGSGRSLPGVDLHALVAASSGRLVRWGGHPGAVGLELRAADVDHFRRAFGAAADGVRGAIERARVREVDAVAGVGELSLRLAEDLDALAPFGRGNPEVRLAVPGCAVARTSRVGEDGRHLEVRIRAHGAHARSIGFSMGPRREGIDTEARHDAVVRLGVERYQELVSPRVTLESLEPLTPRGPVRGMCAQACDIACPARARLTPALLDAPPGLPPAPPGVPVAVRDHRGRAMAVPLVAALAAADGGVLAVVSDVARRRVALETVLEPSRLGIEDAVLAGARCDVAAMADRLAGVRGAPLLALVEYGSLPDLALPAGAHVVLLDPPAHADEAAWALAAAHGRWLHLAWGTEDVDLALDVAGERLDTRAIAAEAWRALSDGARRAWGPDLDAALLGEGRAIRTPRAVGRGLGVLRDVGLVEADAAGVRAVLPAPRSDLDGSGLHRASAERLEECRAFLGRAMTLALGPLPEPLAAASTG